MTDLTLDRRTLLGAACLGCATLATGCGGNDETASPAAPSSTAGAAPAPAPLATLADVPVGGAVAAQAGEEKVLVVRTGEATATAFSARCPHQGCTVVPAGQELACPCHGSRFGTDGARLAGPAETGLAPYAVQVVDGAVLPA